MDMTENPAAAMELGEGLDMGEEMSYAKVVDSRISVDAPKTYVAHDGPASVTYRSILAQNMTSLTPTFSVQTPSYQSGIGRRILYTLEGDITVTGTNLDTLQNGNRVALRAFPLHSCMSSLTVNMNDTTLSLGSLDQYVAALTSVGRSSKAPALAQTTTETAPDLLTNYDDAVAIPGGPFEPVAAGPYSTFSRGQRTGSITNIQFNGTTEMVVSVRISEPLIIQPFDYGCKGMEKAIYGVGTANFNWSLQNVHRMLSLALGPTATVTNVALSPSKQQLETTFISPNDGSLISSDRPYSYDNTDVKLYNTQLSTSSVAPGATLTGSSSTVELSTIPNKFLVYATISEQDRQDPSLSIPDVFLRLESIQIQFGTRAGILASATPRQLWEISTRNGVSLPYSIWAGRDQVASAGNAGHGAGGPLLLDAAADLGLPDGVSPGMNHRIQFLVTSATFQNQTGRTLNGARLVVLALTDGIITNKMGATLKQAGGLPPNFDVETAPSVSEVQSEQVHELASEAGYGGGFFKDFKKGFMKVMKPISKIAGPLASAAPLVGLGSGSGGARMGGALLGGARMGGELLGGGQSPTNGRATAARQPSARETLADKIRGGRAASRKLL